MSPRKDARKGGTKPEGTASSKPLTSALRRILDDREKLRQVEARIDEECHRLVQGLTEEQVRDLFEETYTLATHHPDLRFSDLSPAEAEVREMIEIWSGKGVSQRNVDDLMVAAVRKVFTDAERRRLKKFLYTRISSAENEQQMSLWAVANVSLDAFDAGENPFLLGTFQATLVEQFGRAASRTQDLSRPLSPVDRDIERRVGSELAEKATRIPHLLAFLDLSALEFDPVQFESHALRFFDWAQEAEARTTASGSRVVKEERDRLLGESLQQLLTPDYRQRLIDDLGRIKTSSQEGDLPSEVRDLADAALTLLDRLPPGMHPLLQAIWLRSVDAFIENI